MKVLFEMVILVVASLFHPSISHGFLRNLMIDGRNAYPGEFPSFVAGSGCGGTLIYEDIVLTAAHCHSNGLAAFDESVQIGGTIAPYGDSPDGEIIPTVCVLNHPNFSWYAEGYDIALVKLAHPSTAPIMQVNFDAAVPKENETVTAIGYGVSGYGERARGQSSPQKFPGNLQVLFPLYIQPEAVCSRGSFAFSLDFHLCTNDNDPNTTVCSGDSGGPILNENGTQVGLLSYALFKGLTGECLGYSPVYWTNVAKFDSFIKEGICALSNNPPADCPTDEDQSFLRACLNLPSTSKLPVRPTVSPSKLKGSLYGVLVPILTSTGYKIFLGRRHVHEFVALLWLIWTRI